MKKSLIALAVASIAALGTGTANALTDEEYWVPMGGSSGSVGGTYVGEAPVVASVATAELPPVTVTCGTICRMMLGINPTITGLEYINVGVASNPNTGGGGGAPPPPPPPPPPANKDDCYKNCDNDRKDRDLDCADKSVSLARKLQEAEFAAQRAKLIAKGIKNPYVDWDMIPDAALLDIQQKQTSFDRLCSQVAIQAEINCRTNCKNKFGAFLDIPLLIPGFFGRRAKKA